MKMNFNILKDPMKNIIDNIYPKVKKSPIDEYKMVSVYNKDGKIKVYAGCESVAMRYVVDSGVNEEFQFIVDMKKMNTIVNMVGDVNLKVNDNSVIVSSKNKRIKTARYDTGINSYFSEITRDQFDCVDYGKINLKKGFDVVGKFVSTEKFDDILSNVYFVNDDGKLKCVGLNRAILGVYTYDTYTKVVDGGMTIQPFNFVDDEYMYTACWFDDMFAYNLFTRETEQYKEEIYLRNVGGHNTYPNYKKLLFIDKEPKFHISINKKELEEFIKSTYKLFGSAVTYFAITVDDKITLKSFDINVLDNKYEQIVEDGEADVENGFVIGFNIAYLANLLNNVDDEMFVLTNYGNDGYYNIKEDLVQLIMPVNI